MKFIYDVEKKVRRKNSPDPVAYPEAVRRVLEMSRKIRNYGLYGGLFSDSTFTLMGTGPGEVLLSTPVSGEKRTECGNC